jgi:hypothetical protein
MLVPDVRVSGGNAPTSSGYFFFCRGGGPGTGGEEDEGEHETGESEPHRYEKSNIGAVHKGGPHRGEQRRRPQGASDRNPSEDALAYRVGGCGRKPRQLETVHVSRDESAAQAGAQVTA